MSTIISVSLYYLFHRLVSDLRIRARDSTAHARRTLSTHTSDVRRNIMATIKFTLVSVISLLLLHSLPITLEGVSVRNTSLPREKEPAGKQIIYVIVAGGTPSITGQ